RVDAAAAFGGRADFAQRGLEARPAGARTALPTDLRHSSAVFHSVRRDCLRPPGAAQEALGRRSDCGRLAAVRLSAARDRGLCACEHLARPRRLAPARARGPSLPQYEGPRARTGWLVLPQLPQFVEQLERLLGRQLIGIDYSQSLLDL